MRLLLATLLFTTTISTFAETNIIKKIDYTMELRNSLLWNSVNQGLASTVKCRWSKIDNTTAKLEECYSNNIANYYSLGTASQYIGVGKYHLETRKTITYNAENCSVFAGDELIGHYYADKHCSGFSYDKGFKITSGSVTINEVDRIITID